MVLSSPNRRRFFTGTLPVTVDGQRRLTLPKTWRLPSDAEDTVFYLMPGHNRRIFLVTEERMESIYDSIVGSSMASNDKMDSYIDIGSKIQEIVLDKQGRFALNPTLAEFAGIKDKAVFLGSLVYGVLVAPENWQDRNAPRESSLDILQKMEERKNEHGTV